MSEQPWKHDGKKRNDFIFRSAADPRHKIKMTNLTQAISQKDHELDVTDVALPDEDNVDEARDWVNFNKK